MTEVGEVLVDVRLAVAVYIVQSHDTLAIVHIDGVAHDADAQRFVQAGRESRPLELVETAVHPGHHPHIALEGHDGRSPILEEVDIGHAYIAPPRVG